MAVVADNSEKGGELALLEEVIKKGLKGRKGRFVLLENQ